MSIGFFKELFRAGLFPGIGRFCGNIAVYEIGERDALQIIVHHAVKLLPERQRETVVGVRALRFAGLDAGYRRYGALRNTEDIADGVFLRAAGEPVAAPAAALRLQKPAAAERGDDAFEILFRYVLAISTTYSSPPLRARSAMTRSA